VDPTRAAQITAAKERWLDEARAAVRDGSIAGLRDDELDRLTAGVVSATGAAVAAPPSPRSAPSHQALVLALADALGAALPAAFAAAPDAWFSSTARVSVLICTRNRRELLRTALDALTRQTRAPDEVVVVNNGSTDGTEAVLDAFSARLPLRAVWLEQPGIPGARNAALAAATGDILCFTDDDAIADPGWLAAIEDRFLRDPRVGLVGGETLPDPAQPGLIAAFFRVYMGSEVSG
jgi:cellulose synthase/poly-beta-1,6-N-acetylglucosamine synthase-like glycosyltransferase